MNEHVLGILLSLVAGFSTCVGSLAVFCTSRLNPMVFSRCLALSAGVMLYVSLVEIFREAEVHIKEGMSNTGNPGIPYLITTCCFIVGWIVSTILDQLLHFIMEWEDLRRRKRSTYDPPKDTATTKEQLLQLLRDSFLNEETSPESVENNDSFQKGLHAILEPECTTDIDREPMEIGVNKRSKSTSCFKFKCLTTFSSYFNRHQPDDAGALMEKISTFQFNNDRKRHIQLTVFTAVALGLHNLPEGIATYSATIVNRRVGFGMATAIAIHNIPEGIAVAVPIYYCTGSKLKGVFLAFISGMAEPLGALLAWATIGSKKTITVGIIFAIVCGIMTNVSLKGLYPAALKYDVNDRVSSFWLAIGMIVMALSLVAFSLTAPPIIDVC